MRRLGEVDGDLAVDTLKLHRFFSDEDADIDLRPPTGDGPLDRASRVVCWFGAQDPTFVRRFTRAVPCGIVASPSGSEGLVWQHLVATIPGGDLAPPERVVVDAGLRQEGVSALRPLGWDLGAPLVVVHPGAGSLSKRWPPEAFAAVLAALGPSPLTIGVHQGPADGAAASELMRRLRRPAHFLDEPTLPALAGILALASGFLGNDSGVGHLAAAVGTPSVVLFRTPMLRWRPWAPSALSLEVAAQSADGADITRVTAALSAMLTPAPVAPGRERRTP